GILAVMSAIFTAGSIIQLVRTRHFSNLLLLGMGLLLLALTFRLYRRHVFELGILDDGTIQVGASDGAHRYSPDELKVIQYGLCAAAQGRRSDLVFACYLRSAGRRRSHGPV